MVEFVIYRNSDDYPTHYIRVKKAHDAAWAIGFVTAANDNSTNEKLSDHYILREFEEGKAPETILVKDVWGGDS